MTFALCLLVPIALVLTVGLGLSFYLTRCHDYEPVRWVGQIAPCPIGINLSPTVNRRAYSTKPCGLLRAPKGLCYISPTLQRRAERAPANPGGP